MIFLETIIIRCKIKFCIQHIPRSKYQEEILELTTDFTYVSRCSEKMTQNPRFSIERSLFFFIKLFSRPYRHIERKKIEKKTLSRKVVGTPWIYPARFWKKTRRTILERNQYFMEDLLVVAVVVVVVMVVVVVVVVVAVLVVDAENEDFSKTINSAFSSTNSPLLNQ